MKKNQVLSTRKKIILCSNVYPPNFIGGAELIAHSHARIIKQLGHEVIIFTGDINLKGERYSLKKENYEGLTVYRIHLQPEDYYSDFPNFSHKEVEKQFTALIDDFYPDIVHFHNIIGLSVGLIYIAKSRGIKTVLTLHDHWGFCYKNTILKGGEEVCHNYSYCEDCMPFIHDEEGKSIPIQMRRNFIEMQLGMVDIFVSPSQYLADAYISAGFPKEKFRIIWNGIDVDKFSHLSKTKANGIVRFSFIGRFGRHKGVHILLDALRFVYRRDRIKVNLIGEGEEIDSYHCKIKESHYEGLVKFWGKVDNRRIEKVYRETDVLILPSIWPENQPVSITEAMASRTPVIAACIGGVPELIEDGITGYLFEPGDAKDLANRMLEFVLDPNKIKTFGENGFNKIMNYTFENQVDKILRAYDEAQLDYYDEAQADYILIVCVGDHVEPRFAQGMLTFLRNKKQDKKFYFTMSEWLEKEQANKAKLLCVTDVRIGVESIIPGLENKIPLLVPDDNIKLKNLCRAANCGLFYRDAEEVEGCLEYILQNDSISRVMGENGFKLLLKHEF